MATRSLGTLTLDLIAKIGGFEAGMDKAARASDKRMKQIRNSAQGVARAIKGVFAAIGLGLGAREIIQATIRQENAVRQLEQRLISTGGVAGVTSQELQDFASSLQRVTTYGDEAIIEMQSLLLTFTNLRGDVLNGATEAVLNVATALGVDLKSAALQVGKALNDPVLGISALSEAGIQFSENQKELIKSLVASGRTVEAQGIILKELEVQFGGAARAAADTFGGAMQQAKNAFGDLLEAPGGLEDGKEAFQELTRILQDPATVAAAQALTGSLIWGFSAATEAIAGTVNVMRFLGEELASRTAGANSDDVVRLQEQLELAEELRRSLTFDDVAFGSGVDAILKATGLDRVRFFGKDGLVEYYDDAELDQEITRLKKLIDDKLGGSVSILQPVQVSAQRIDSFGQQTQAAPSEEFTKLSEKLEEQIALYGKAGKEAEILYQIQSGALDELSPKEQEHLLTLAKQYDARVAEAKAIEDAQKASEALQAAGVNRIEQLEKELYLANDNSRLAQLRYEIEKGSLVGINDEMQKRLYLLTEEAQQIEENSEIQERLAALRRDSLTNEERALADLQARYAEISELIQSGNLSPEEGSELAADFLKQWDEAAKAAEGATNDMSEYAKSAAANMQSAFADFLFDPFENGLDGMLKSFDVTLRRMAAEAASAQIFDFISGAAGGSGGFGDLFAGLFDSGGTIGAGQFGIVGEVGPELVRGPATVVSREQTARMMNGGTFNVTMNFPGVRNERDARQAGGAAARQLSRVASSGQRYE